MVTETFDVAYVGALTQSVRQISLRRKTLTVGHLYNASGAGDAGGKLVTSRHDVARFGAGHDRLVGFGCPARWVQVVPSGVVRIDG